MCNRIKPPTNRQLKKLMGEGFSLEGLDDIVEMSSGFDHPSLPAITDFYTPTMQLLEWGLISHKCADEEVARGMQARCLNARADTIFERWAYKDVIYCRRCIILIQGFYEYQHLKEGKKTKKTPYFVDLKDTGLMPVAGIWDEWRGRKTCAIITTDANPLMKEIYNSKERQPHIIEQANWEEWLGPIDHKDIERMLQTYPDDNMRAQEYCMPTAPPARPKDPSGELF